MERMRGMFAWCLLDADRGTAWLCRDRLGVKPLYFARPASGGLLFASEVRTLLAAGPPSVVGPRIDRAALESYLAQGACAAARASSPASNSPAAGRVAVGRLGGPAVAADYVLGGAASPADETAPVPADVGLWPAHAAPGWERTAGETVKMRSPRRRAVGVVPGSGGIDSSPRLATVATEVAGTDVQTVSIGFDQPEFDESEAAEESGRGPWAPSTAPCA